MKFDIENPDLAEVMFYFVGQKEIFEDFCACQIENDLSIAEYVKNYRLAEFREYLEREYHFEFQ